MRETKWTRAFYRRGYTQFEFYNDPSRPFALFGKDGERYDFVWAYATHEEAEEAAYDEGLTDYEIEDYSSHPEGWTFYDEVESNEVE